MGRSRGGHHPRPVTYFTSFAPPATTGFELVAGQVHGLRRLMVAGGRIPAGGPSRMHLHAGDEVIRIVSGEIIMRVGDERRIGRAGDVVIVPPNTLHGFIVVTETVMEVVAEQDIGTYYPIRQADGTRRLVEIFTPLPWNRLPPDGATTTTEEIERLARDIDVEV